MKSKIEDCFVAVSGLSGLAKLERIAEEARGVDFSAADVSRVARMMIELFGDGALAKAKQMEVDGSEKMVARAIRVEIERIALQGS